MLWKIDPLKSKDKNHNISCDLAGERPMYLYWAKNKNSLIYSDSINELLNFSEIKKSLEISDQGISFMLQSGAVPPPQTVYKNIYILSIGDTAEVKIVKNKIEVFFQHKFPFKNSERLNEKEMKPNQNYILDLILSATLLQIDHSKPSFLFHSAGKDSNAIALSLAKANMQANFTLLTYKSATYNDESELSAAISRRLGFAHRVIQESDTLSDQNKDDLVSYFTNAPFPSIDNATLALPLALESVPELRVGANVIDGGGNDVYMSMPPTSKELKILHLSQFISKAKLLRSYIRSDRALNVFLRTPAEVFATSGLSFFDSSRIFPRDKPVVNYWQTESRFHEGWDIYDFKSDILGTKIIPEVHVRKVRNFTDAFQGNAILPFTGMEIALYFSKLPENYLFDRRLLKNKLVLRKILYQQLDLDSDLIGKRGWGFNSRNFIQKNFNFLFGEIATCEIWDQAALSRFVKRLINQMGTSGYAARASERHLLRLFLISGWYNHSRYLNKS